MGSSASSNCHNYYVKKTFIEVVEDETRSRERPRRSVSCSAASSRLACGDHESGNGSTHSFDSYSRTSSSCASSAAGKPHSSDADGDSGTMKSTDFLSVEDGEEGEEAEGSWSTGNSSGRVYGGVGQWTPGAEKHAAGQCKPCRYLTTKAGCMNGNECRWCHMDHPQRVRLRPCKSARMKCKRMAAKLDQVKQNEPENLDNAIDSLQTRSSQSRYLLTVLKCKLLKMQDDDGPEDGVAESSDQAGQDVCNMIISL